MKDYVDELLIRLEVEHPEIYAELHGHSARRNYGDMKLEIARQQRFIMRHMPTIWAKVDESRVVNQEVVNEIPILYVREKIIYHFRKTERNT